MSPDGQERFRGRVFNFISSKNFIGREDLVVTDEMRVLISASAVQITFGLRDYTISHLHTINIFPHIFYSKLFKTSFKGLTTQGGVLSLSWNDFKEGFTNEHDNLNLGFHELAHALNIDLDEDGNYDKHFSDYFEKWKEVALIDLLQLKAKKISFFRKYAATNMHEFFAVCIEYFFESPEEFKKQLPVLYVHTMILLNQDPSNKTEDYTVNNSVRYFAEHGNSSLSSGLILNDTTEEDDLNAYIQERQLQKFIRTKGIYVAMMTTAIGLFIGLPLLFWFASVTVISIGTLMLLIFGCGALGLIQWKYVREFLDMEYHQFSMYAFTGFGICLVNFILFLNYTIPIKTHTETYTISRIGYHNESYEVILSDSDNSALEGSLATYFNEHYAKAPSANKVTVVFETGLFGFDIIKDCEFS